MSKVTDEMQSKALEGDVEWYQYQNNILMMANRAAGDEIRRLKSWPNTWTFIFAVFNFGVLCGFIWGSGQWPF